ncbi:hypothetical protein SLS62_003402 [Diatrype stigma]|uniref:Uncharacterized protein n=1 Tax=Diatrype stigma TaxID=117547 RepID=A0AAN9V504_9PEZI
MPLPYEYDDSGWKSHSHQTLSRSPSSGSCVPSSRRVVEPTEENQRIYNQTKAEQTRHQVASHTNDDLLIPPNAGPAMTRSESCASSNRSGSEDPPTPAPLEPTATNNGHTRRLRGRRNRPLDADTRFHTALKRKLKLTCDKHRQKKTTCDCYDFSKLEEAYRRGQMTTERRQHRLSHSSSSNSRPTPYLAPREPPPAVVTTTTPFEQQPEHSFFATGGGILLTDPSLSSSSSPSAHNSTTATTDEYDHLADPLPAVPRNNVERLVNRFDTASVYLHPQMVAESAIGNPYLPGSSPALLSSSPLSPQRQYEPLPPRRSQPQPQFSFHQFWQPQQQQQQHDNRQPHQNRSNTYRHRSYSQQLSPYSYQRTTETTMQPHPYQQRHQHQHQHHQQKPQPQTQQQQKQGDIQVIPIGSQMLGPGLATIWKCQYGPSTTTATHDTTAGPGENEAGCMWTGPFHELHRHFEAAHHAVREAEPEPRMSLCLACKSMWPGWNVPGGCLAEGCSPYSNNNNTTTTRGSGDSGGGGGGAILQKWYYGCYSIHDCEPGSVGTDAGADDGDDDGDGDGDLESLASGYSEGAFSWSGGGGGDGGWTAGGGGGGGARSWWGSFSSGGGGGRGG